MAAVADLSNDRMKTALIAGAGVAAVAGAAYYASKYLFGKKTSEWVGSSSMDEFPVIDISAFLDGKADEATCQLIAEQLHKNGLLIVRDPRVTFADNDKFIDMMEKYFEQPESAKKEDERPEVFYQVGVTPNGKEQARDHCAKVAAMPEQERPITECPPGADPKWRFFWRIGQTPAETKFARLSAPQVVPRAFPEWSSNMNAWGEKILATVFTVAEMAAIGFKLPRETFVSMLKMGPHLLAPTGSDMSKFGQLKTVFAKFHYDLNFLTIHGRSRYPGLYVWTRDGKRLPVKIPEGCLLLQAGKQFEYVTGGYVLAGFHEVVVSPATLETIEKARKNGKSLWRISSTLFAHVASDKILQPIESFATPEAKAKFPPLPAGEQVQNELKAIKLASPDAVTAM